MIVWQMEIKVYFKYIQMLQVFRDLFQLHLEGGLLYWDVAKCVHGSFQTLWKFCWSYNIPKHLISLKISVSDNPLLNMDGQNIAICMEY